MKNKIISLMLFLLYKGLQSAYHLDPQINREINSLPNDFVFELGIAGGDTSIMISIKDGNIVKVKSLPQTKHLLQIFFKSRAAAWRIVTGKMSIPKAYSRYDLLILGDLHLAMIINRCLECVENYLFPRFIKRDLFEIVPIKAVSSLRIILNMFKFSRKV